MPLGPLGELRQWKRLLDPASRYNDIAVQFAIHERRNNKPYPTGERSEVYGGRWDTWGAEYVSPADPRSVLILPCSRKQLEGVLDDSPRVEGAGGRGAGKSEGGILKAIKNIAARPGEDGRILSPSFPLVRVVRTKLLNQLYLAPASWILSIKKQEQEIWFRNGVRVKFNSSSDPASLRSDGFAWTFADEAQDSTTEALDVAWFCLRESAAPQLWMALTPQPGETYKRHVEYTQDPETSCLEYDSYSNPFTDKKVFDFARSRMDKKRFAVEVMVSWDTVAEMEEQGALKPMFPAFNRDTHAFDQTDFDKDVTKLVAQKRMAGIPRGYTWNYICGVDPNGAVPNFAVIYKVFRRGDCSQDLWVAWEVIKAKGHCGHLGRVIKRAGYAARDVLIIPDFSSRYNRLGNPRSSSALLREEGFFVINRPKNPRVKFSIDDVQAKLDPVDGTPSLLFRLPEVSELADAMEAALFNKDGTGFDKSTRVDVCDAMRYPISFFEPSARVGANGIQVYMAK